MDTDRIMLFFAVFLLLIGSWRIYTLLRGEEKTSKMGAVCWFLMGAMDLAGLLLDLPQNLPWTYYVPDVMAVLLCLSLGVIELVLLRRRNRR